MKDYSKLVYLPLDIPNPPNIIKYLDGISERTDDPYRISPCIILADADGKWLGAETSVPEFTNWVENELFARFGRVMVVVITTPPNSDMSKHIDCSPEKWGTSWQHKLRCVLQGDVDTLHFIGEDFETTIPPIDAPYVINGRWPHYMTNTTNKTKYTLCLGHPWEPSEDNIEYIELLNQSLNKYSEYYISSDNIMMPVDYAKYFDSEIYKV